MYLNEIEKIHIIGIGGIGMSGIAEILLAQGKLVSGSDIAASPITERLANKKAEIFIGHNKSNISPETDLTVYSSAVKPDNPELIRAGELKIKAVKRPEMLAALTKEYFTIGVAGVHGKTTTTSMLAKIMFDAGLDPTILIGGNVPWLDGANARLGGKEYFVIEADEYDKTFLSLYLSAAIITNLEHEHKDIYPTFDEEKECFVQFANSVGRSGINIISGDDENLMKIKPKINRKVKIYSVENDADYRAVNLKRNLSNQTFDLFKGGKNLGAIELPLRGIHNVKNALAASAMALELNIDFEDIRDSLRSFENAERRLELKYDNYFKIIDDYAHHPTEIKAGIEAVRGGYPDSELTIIFQPHLYSRTRDFYEEFGDALSEADRIIVTGIYPAREKPIAGVTGKLIVNAIIGAGNMNAVYIENIDAVPEFLSGRIRENEIILTMGAGDVFKIGKKIIKSAEK